MMIGNALAEAGDLAGAQPVLERSLEAFCELGDEHYTGVASVNLAWVSGDLGDKDRERALHEENLERARALQNRRLEVFSFAQLAMLARDEGRLQEASVLLKESLRGGLELGDRLELAINLGRMANVLALAGRAEPAARLLSSSEALTESVGASTPWWAGDRNEQTLTVIREQLDEAAIDEAWGQGRALTLDEAVEHALDTQLDA
jgi:non-specific serine/threonine protein kinase